MQELEIFKINYDNEKITLSARDLHEFLKINTRYSIWFDRMKEYGFVENADFVAIVQKRTTAQGNETTYTDHEITIDMAKEIAMLQRNEKGKQARQYFIELEKKWNSPEMVMSRAMLQAKAVMEKQTQVIAELEDRNGRLDRKIEEDAPKVEQFDKFINSNGLYTLRDTAKLLNYPPNALNNLLIENGYLFRTGHKGKLCAYQTRLRQGLFKLKTFEYGEGLTSHQVMVTPKGVSKINNLITELENIEDDQYALEFKDI